MTLIPKTHPRAESLKIRQRLVDGFDQGLVAKEGLLAQGRGEAFDYLLGEKTTRPARRAIKATAATLLSAVHPIISVNGNVAALCPKQLVQLAKSTNADLEVNLFYASDTRKNKIAKILEKNGATTILGLDKSQLTELDGTDSERRFVDKRGMYMADVIVIPLEDGDRTQALHIAGKTVITFDLNPLSRTAKTANITIVDNITRAITILIKEIKYLSKNNTRLKSIISNFDNKKNLQDSISMIQNNLTRRAAHA